jgi:hypothetical protein
MECHGNQTDKRQLFIGFRVVFRIRDRFELWNNILSQRVHGRSATDHASMYKVYSHRQPHPKVLGNRHHSEREHLPGSSAGGTD